MRNTQPRWCSYCKKEVDKDSARTREWYRNAYGVFDVPDGTSLTEELKLTARLAYVSNMAPPLDVSAWSGFVEQLLQRRGYTSVVQIQEPGDWYIVCVEAATQAPRVVAEAFGVVRDYHAVCSVREWEACVERLALLADSYQDSGRSDVLAACRGRSVCEWLQHIRACQVLRSKICIPSFM